jgi:two-component system response regulator HydG
VGDPVKVLVVDDDRRMVKTICDILRIKGYEAVPAYTGSEALELVRSCDPVCVLMDVKMPGMDGVETAKGIKSQFPDLPVILMSAYVTEEVAEKAKTQGAVAVLAKPFDIQAVLSFLSSLGA